MINPSRHSPTLPIGLAASLFLHAFIVAIPYPEARRHPQAMASAPIRLYASISRPTSEISLPASTEPPSEASGNQDIQGVSELAAAGTSVSNNSSSSSELGSTREKPAIQFVREIDLDSAPDLERDGYVEIELLVSAEGRLIKATLIDTDISKEFYELVAETFQDAYFFPGKVNGRPVADKLRFKVFFSQSHPH